MGLLCMRGNKHKGGSVVVAAAGTTTATAATLPHAMNANLTLKNTRRKEREREGQKKHRQLSSLAQTEGLVWQHVPLPVCVCI